MNAGAPRERRPVTPNAVLAVGLWGAIRRVSRGLRVARSSSFTRKRGAGNTMTFHWLGRLYW
jgi:hypothetical protein